MKGISFITDAKNRKTALIIDLKSLQKHEDEIHEMIDVLVAEARKDDVFVDWHVAKQQLKIKGRNELSS